MIAEDTRKVIAALQKNAKESVATMAKHCQMSEQRFVRTMKYLERNNKIWGYTAIVDEREHGVHKFVLLLKRTAEKFDPETLDDITMNQFKKDYAPLGVTIESSYYLHGEYDWLVIFTAADLIQAKKFSKILFDHYPGIAAKVALMQVIFTNRAHHISNPDQTKLREFI